MAHASCTVTVDVQREQEWRCGACGHAARVQITVKGVGSGADGPAATERAQRAAAKEANELLGMVACPRCGARDAGRIAGIALRRFAWGVVAGAVCAGAVFIAVRGSAVDTIGGGAVALLATIIAAFNFTRSAAALFGRKAPDEVRFLP